MPISICRYHHERWDGRGYPDGLKGDSIPICAQVVGIADCYDALTNDRVYKKAIPSPQAYNMILNGECGAFSPRLLECFKNVREMFAQLTRDYADGMDHPQMLPMPRKTGVFNPDDTLEIGQQKYFTLLQYADATVVEVDFNNGFYHVIYLSSPDFELLKAGSSFEDSMRKFVLGAVHPDDRQSLLKLSVEGVLQFFDDGRTRQNMRYRVYQRSTGSYQWCQMTLMRVNTVNPKRRRAMFIWKPEYAWEGNVQLENGPAMKECPSGSFSESIWCGDDINVSRYGFILDNLLDGIQTCRNDKWFTLLHMNQRLLNLLEYTEEEIKTHFNRHYAELIHPADRKMVAEQVREQLTSGNYVELEYRLRAKDGHCIWVLDKGWLISEPDGGEYFLCILVDVSQSKKVQEALRQSLERHRIIMEQSNDIIFEWDIANDEVTYSGNWQKKFGYLPICRAASRDIPRISHVHPGDMAILTKLFAEMSSGVPYAEYELRIADTNGRYRWYKIRVAAQFDDMGKAIKAVGVLMDIDEEKRASQLLMEEAQRDGLTRLYNKGMSQKLIEEQIENMGAANAALLIIDMDNFKKINDNYGHMFGDTVLQDFADELQKLFRASDIISRIGGDEFLVFMQDIPDTDVVKSRAAMIIEASHRTLRLKDIPYLASCSIGIAFYPEHGTDFSSLFKCSDLALYNAKSRGKNIFSVYDPNAMGSSFELPERGKTQLIACEEPAGANKEQGDIKGCR